MKRAALLLMLLALPTMAISPHVLRLETVVQYADWIVVAKVVEVSEVRANSSSGVRLKVEIERVIHGQPPSSPAELSYWEGWPAQAPDGKVEAPIWTGSSLERQLNPGDQFLAIGSGDSTLERAEPLSKESEIQKILKP